MDFRATFGRNLTLAALALSGLFLAGRALAEEIIRGQVLGGGAPIAQSTVTLWQASAGAPKQLAQTKTDNDGHFTIHGTGASDSTLYLVAKGGVAAANKAAGNNPVIALIAVVGIKLPAKVVINEFTTIASVVTHNQFTDGTAIKGPPLALRIAAGNVPNFVNLETGGYGETILDGLNSTQTPTMANFGTLANLLAACVSQSKTDACGSLFYVATSPTGVYPKDTLDAVESIVRNPWYQPDKVFGAFSYLYPQPQLAPGKLLRPTPFMPYLNFSPGEQNREAVRCGIGLFHTHYYC